jgi:hypothetical protein
MGRGLNRVMGRTERSLPIGTTRSLCTPTEVSGRSCYVLGNVRKHLPAIGRKPRADWSDAYSSAVATGPPGARPGRAPDDLAAHDRYVRAAGRIHSEESPSGHSPPAAVLSSAAARGALAGAGCTGCPENAHA